MGGGGGGRLFKDRICSSREQTIFSVDALLVPCSPFVQGGTLFMTDFLEDKAQSNGGVSSRTESLGESKFFIFKERKK